MVFLVLREMNLLHLYMEQGVAFRLRHLIRSEFHCKETFRRNRKGKGIEGFKVH